MGFSSAFKGLIVNYTSDPNCACILCSDRGFS